MGTVIRLSNFCGNPLDRPTGSGSARLSQFRSHSDFTLRDRADLDAWSGPDRRVVLCSSDTGTFAMLYQNGVSWASWGVVRQGRTVSLWDCVTHADIGRFPNMMDALRAVPITGQTIMVPSILCFAAVAQHSTAAL